MKKFLLTTMMAALMVCAAGCGNNAEDNNAGANEGGNTEATVTPVPTQAPVEENASGSDAAVDASVNEGEFKAGAYAGNASYTAGEFSMSWIFTVNFLADGTFTLINDSGEEKGAGTYALTEQCYTMTYSDSRTGTFVVQADGNLKVTSDLPYGQASISPDMVGGIVLTYNGEASEAGSSEQAPAEDTAKEPAADDTTTAEGYSLAAGSYVASYTKESAMAGTVVYNYVATVGEDGTFSYSVSFAMGDTTYDGSAASGTYTLEGIKFVFTDSEGNVTEGAVTAENTLVISLNASAMAKTPYEVTFVPGSAEAAEGYSLAAGSYVASYTKESAMAGTVVYNYVATVGEDGTFSYSVSFAMGDTTYDGSAASGTYTLEGSKFVFTDSEGNVTEGAVTAENTLVISLSASAMAKAPYEVTFVPAQ